MEPGAEENADERAVSSGIDVMTCAECGKAVLDRESSFCAYCGASFDSKPGGLSLASVAGVLAMVAAVFSTVVGVMGVYYYQYYVAYFSSVGADSSGALGFLLFAGFTFVSGPIGFAGGMFALGRKRFLPSVVFMLVLLASALFTFVVLWRFDYGVIDLLLFPGISIGAFSVVSVVLAVRCRRDFSQA